MNENQISADLRTLTAEIEELDAEIVAHGLLGGHHGYGAEYANDVFEMHPFWWGDCECGHEAREGEWADAHPHTPACYQSLIDWDAPREQVDTAVARLCAEMGLDPYYGSYVHCTCGHTEAWQSWVEENRHPAQCPVVRPNFRHHASGFEVRWYKYIGRSMEVSGEADSRAWRALINECFDSLRGSADE